MKASGKSLAFIVFGVIFLFLFSLGAFAIENSECLDCHGDPDFTVELPNGKVKSLYVNPDKFKVSVHGTNEIACTDCHSDITKLNYEKEVPHKVPVAKVNCSDCHDSEQESVEESVHSKSISPKAPECFNCHSYHYTERSAALTVDERDHKFCLRCHDPLKSHNWLPQKEFHFARVECSVCHSPEAPKFVALRFYNPITEEVIPSKKILEALGATYEDFLEKLDKNKNGKLDTEELATALAILKKKGIHAAFMGELVVDMDPSVHSITKEKAIKECSKCHSEKSSILSNVQLVLGKGDKTAETYPVSKAALTSFHVGHFYAISATRIKVIDIIGLLIVLGGIAFAGGHGTIRMLTIPLRRKNK